MPKAVLSVGPTARMRRGSEPEKFSGTDDGADGEDFGARAGRGEDGEVDEAAEVRGRDRVHDERGVATGG